MQETVENLPLCTKVEISRGSVGEEVPDQVRHSFVANSTKLDFVSNNDFPFSPSTEVFLGGAAIHECVTRSGPAFS